LTTRPAAAPAPAAAEQDLGRTLWLLVAASTLCFLPFGAYAATVPRWLDSDLGAGPALIGVLMASMSVAAVVSRPLAGRLSDLRGRRLAAVIGALLSAAGALALLVPPVTGVVALARAAVGIGEALVTTACMAWIVDATPAARRGRAMSWFGMSVWLGMSVGPQAGELARELGGFDLVWVLAAVATLTAAALLAAVPDSSTAAAGERAAFRVPRAVLVPGSAMGLAVFGEGVLIAFGVQHLLQRGVQQGAGVGGAASVYSVLAAGALVSRPFIASLPDRLGGRACGISGTALVSIGLAGLAVASSFGAAAVAAVSMGCGLALLYPSLSLLVAADVGPERRGVAMGAFTAFVDVGVGVGALAGGVLVSAFSTSAAFWAGAAAALMGGLLLLLRVPGRGPRVPA
jgi:MFS family permease